MHGFTQANAKAIHLILDLPKLVIQVAHSGSKFDFKLLKVDVTSVDYFEECTNQQCTDTLKAIKEHAVDCNALILFAQFRTDALHENDDIPQIITLIQSFSIDHITEDDSPLIAKSTWPEDAAEVHPSDTEGIHLDVVAGLKSWLAVSRTLEASQPL